MGRIAGSEDGILTKLFVDESGYMGPLFGMAGMEKLANITGIGLLCFGTFVVGTLALFALTFRSRIAALVCLGCNGYLAWVLCPWEAFTAQSNDDPDWQGLLISWRTAATLWLALSIFATAVAIWTFWHRPLPTPSVEDSPSNNLEK